MLAPMSQTELLVANEPYGERKRERVREREHGSRVKVRVRGRIIINNSTRHVDGLGTPLF